MDGRWALKILTCGMLMLYVCLASILDDGSDAIHVLNHLAGTILRTSQLVHQRHMQQSSCSAIPTSHPMCLYFSGLWMMSLWARTCPNCRTKLCPCGSYALPQGLWTCALSKSPTRLSAHCRRAWVCGSQTSTRCSQQHEYLPLTPLISSTMSMNMQRCRLACPGQQWIFSMGSIIACSLESVLLLQTECYPMITLRTIMISCLALPPTALLHSRSRSIPSSFSIIISLQTNASKRTTFFVLVSYLVQRSHGMRLLHLSTHENCWSLRLVCLHMTPSLAASLPSVLILSHASVTFLPFPCSCT